ncbi:MAG: hypothetical protein H6581_02350 [Bacteroidia bacterium]|nr:hypothetical protein [Bacteroidia bacterium]
MELKFKTNLKCEGCIQKVSDAPDHEPGVESWEVDLKSPDKTLFLQGKNIEISRIEAIFREKGYEAKEIKTFFKKMFG